MKFANLICGWCFAYVQAHDGEWHDNGKRVYIGITAARPRDSVIGFSVVLFSHHFGLCRLRKHL